jgi:leucyl aminopeptidase (aminopeptidase T)
VRCIGRVDLRLQDELQNRVVELTRRAREMRVTNAAGTDIRFENSPERPVLSEMWAHQPGARFLLGQIAWAPIEQSIQGRIAFDGSFYGGAPADLPRLSQPIVFHVKDGVCGQITGGAEAKFVRQWLESLHDANMYHEAHICYGLNPGARASGICVEDERIWGVTEWGFGHQGIQFKAGGLPAVSHLDGICLNSSVWQDGEQVLDGGRFVHPQLLELSARLGK